MNSNSIEYIELDFKSDLQKQSVLLRDEILRKPLGLEFSKDELEEESNQFHLAAVSDNIILGILLLQVIDSQRIKMRQVAVQKKLQGKGIGKALVLFSEKFAMNKGYTKMGLHARMEAVPFYEKLGYETFGEQFIEVNIPHYFMSKELK
jgi:N-acetylglutamate synthase-like GNAT family acetyltransferase